MFPLIVGLGGLDQFGLVCVDYEWTVLFLGVCCFLLIISIYIVYQINISGQLTMLKENIIPSLSKPSPQHTQK